MDASRDKSRCNKRAIVVYIDDRVLRKSLENLALNMLMPIKVYAVFELFFTNLTRFLVNLSS